MAESYVQRMLRGQRPWPPQPAPQRSIRELLGDYVVNPIVNATQPESWRAKPGYAKGLSGELTDAAMQATRLSDIEAMGEVAKKYGAGKVGAQDAISQMVLSGMGGPLAKTADLKALSQAEHMLSNGFSMREIKKATGWEKDPEGNWGFDIPDINTRMKGVFRPEDLIVSQPKDPYGVPEFARLKDIYEAPDTYAAYPHIGELEVDPLSIGTKLGSGYGGAFISQRGMTGRDYLALNKKLFNDPKTLRTIIVHEVEHAIQKAEGRGARAGTSSISMSKEENQASEAALQAMKQKGDEVEAIIQRYKKGVEEGTIQPDKRKLLDYQKALDKLRKYEFSDFGYMSNVKEWAARIAEKKKDVPPEQLRKSILADYEDMFPAFVTGMKPK